MNALTIKVLKVISDSKSIIKSFQSGYGYQASVTIWELNKVYLHEYNGLFKVYFDGIAVGILHDNEAEQVRDALWDKTRELKNSKLNEFLNID